MLPAVSPAPRRAPALGEHTGRIESAPGSSRASDGSAKSQLPLEGIRILDMTAWWAGPAASHILATFGAEVIHVEAATRPDGMRSIGNMMAGHYGDWWEASPHFMHTNSNKLAITLDLAQPSGLELIEKLF